MFEFPRMTSFLQRNWLWITAVLGLTLYRLVAGFQNPLPFQVDEAQYVGWSYAPSFGYYSKPPFIAWAINGGHNICMAANISGLEGCSRLLQPVAFLIATLGVTAAAYRITKSQGCAVWAGLIFLTSPLSGFYSLFATTDAWLLMFWSLAALVLILAIQSSSSKPYLWVLCGTFVGLGFLSKYSMGAIVVSTFLYFFRRSQLRTSGPWIFWLTALIVASPNLIWNLMHEFPTVVHVMEISQLSNASRSDSAGDLIIRLGSVARFVSEQAILFGPITLAVLIAVVRGKFFKRRSHQHEVQKDLGVDNSGLVLMHYLTWVILILACLQAFSSRSFANWAAPASLSGSVLASYYLHRRASFFSIGCRHSLLACACTFGLAISLSLVQLPKAVYSQSNSDHHRFRVIEKIRGWKEIALSIRSFGSAGWIVCAEDRRLLAAIAAYSYPDILGPYAWSPERRRESHYHWFYDIEGQSFDPGHRILFLQLVKPNSSPSQPNIAGLRVVRMIDVSMLDSLQIGADGERVVAFELHAVS